MTEVDATSHRTHVSPKLFLVVIDLDCENKFDTCHVSPSNPNVDPQTQVTVLCASPPKGDRRESPEVEPDTVDRNSSGIENHCTFELNHVTSSSAESPNRASHNLREYSDIPQ